MMQVAAKVYYLKSIGNILVITSEMEGCVSQTTKEEDMQLYEELKEHSLNEVDFIELLYGTVAKTFINAKSYKVNTKTKTLEITYYRDDELKVIQTQNEEVESTSDRVSTVTEYLNQHTSAIADFEDYILQKEQNKILGVV